jgi:hypothetical protein
MLTTTYTNKSIDVVFLTDPEASHVSLVPKGANWKPFSVVKEETDKMPGQIIQSLLLPKGVTIEDMLDDKEYDFLRELKAFKFAKSAVKKHPNYNYYEILSEDKFVSIDGKPLSNGGIVTFGTLTEEFKPKKKDALIEINIDTDSDEDEEQEAGEMAAQDMDMPMDESDDEDECCNGPAATIILAEIEVFEAIITAACQQNMVSPQKRKDIIMTSLKSFTAFISDTLDTFDTTPAETSDQATTDTEDTGEMVMLQEKKPCEDDEETEKDSWDSAYVNALPDSAFVVVEKAYDPDKEGLSDKNARHLPVFDAENKIDLPHLRNAFARAGQIVSVLGKETDQELRDRAEKRLEELKHYLTDETTKSEDTPNETGGFTMFEPTPELKQFILNTLTEIKEAEKAEKPETEVVTEESIKALTDSLAQINEKLEATVDNIKSELKTITTKTEALEHGILGSRTHAEDVTIPVQPKTKSVFDGAFV